MSSTRRAFLSIVGAAVVMGGAVLVLGNKDALPLGNLLPAKDPVTISVASSVTKQKWLDAMRTAFLAEKPRMADGRPIEIEISSVLSGDSMLQIGDGTLTPTVWSPGETTWVDQLNERWSRKHPKPITSAACEPTVLTPVGIAMWQPMAEALGWPDKPVSLKALVDLANDPNGWASLGHPEWGRLRLGHTHPQYSSAGLLFLASVIYATTGKTEGITARDIYSPDVEAALTALEQNTAKYGMVTTDLLTSMAAQGPAFLHATSAFEEGAVRFNVERAQDLRWPLAFLFPAEGTFWSNHPFCILDQSGWVSPEQAEAARLFQDYLRSPAAQAQAGAFYVRPLDAGVPLGDGLSRANGTTPTASPATVPDLEIPSPDISEAIIDQFLATKRKATAIILIDTSGSMEGDKVRSATEATAAFIDRFDPADKVGLIEFNTMVRTISAPKPMAETGEDLQAKVRNLVAEGSTRMNSAVCRAANMIKDEQEADRAKGENRLYGIILLSDGKDSGGDESETEMYATCLETGGEQEGPKIFAIAFGSDADTAVLERLAQETRGAFYKAEPASIGAAYLRISAEQ